MFVDDLLALAKDPAEINTQYEEIVGAVDDCQGVLHLGKSTLTTTSTATWGPT